MSTSLAHQSLISNSTSGAPRRPNAWSAWLGISVAAYRQSANFQGWRVLTERCLAFFLAILLPALASGCATAAAPDPIEPLNRKVFAFNEHLDTALLKPIATTYSRTVPAPVQKGVTNFFDNARDLWSAVNLLMQGEGKDGSREILRFGVNTTVGLLGIFDIATAHGLDSHQETFGRTLGRWGVEPGAYLVLPVLGSSTARDSAGLPLDFVATPLSVIQGVPAAVALTSTNLVNQRALAIPLSTMVDAIALDKYLYVRDAYLQRHRARPRGE